jgi:hypothetical protein
MYVLFDDENIPLTALRLLLKSANTLHKLYNSLYKLNSFNTTNDESLGKV